MLAREVTKVAIGLTMKINQHEVTLMAIYKKKCQTLLLHVRIRQPFAELWFLGDHVLYTSHVLLWDAYYSRTLDTFDRKIIIQI